MSKGLEIVRKKINKINNQNQADRGDIIWDFELDTIEKELKRLEEQDKILKIIKEVIQFIRTLPEVKIDDNGDFGSIVQGLSLKIQRDLENEEREFFRNWILKECFPQELKALEVIKDMKPFVLEIWDNRYWIKVGKCHLELPKEKYDLLTEVLL